jgi:ubiquinone/menaquinone biosynthesis C-methylase UbiE
VFGIDASPEMITRANKKAKKQGIDVPFQNGVVEALPFPDTRFDLVLSSLMLHHLPKNAREKCAREIARVLRPNGRVLVVDFGEAEPRRKGFLRHLHPHHGYVKPTSIIDLLGNAGLKIIESGEVGVRNMSFVLAGAPSASS